MSESPQLDRHAAAPGAAPVPPRGVAVDFDPFADDGDVADLTRAVRPTDAQREVWLADKLGAEASLAYNEAVALDIDGPLDNDRLRRAFSAVVAAHESLRATFSGDGGQMLVHRSLDGSPIDTVDLSALAPGEQDARIAAYRQGIVSKPFALQTGPLVRARLLTRSPRRSTLLICAHHIVCDGYSFGLLVSDLCAAYRGQALAGSAYGDYAVAERERDGSTAQSDDIGYWTRRFEGRLPTLELPTDRVRPARRTFASRRIDHAIDAATLADAKAAAAGMRVSLFTLLLGTFELLMARLAGTADVVVGVPAAGQSAAEMPDLIGHCVNLLPIRTAIDTAAGTDDWLRSLQSGLLDAFDHQRVTFGTLLSHLPVGRDPSRLPLVSVMFNLDQPLDATGLVLGDARVAIEPLARVAENFELFVNATPTAAGLRLECQYNTGLFDAATVTGWLQCFETLLRSIVAAPQRRLGRQPMLPPVQRALVDAWNATDEPSSLGLDLVTLLDRAAAAHPDRTAIACGSLALDYRSLTATSRRLAAELIARGAGPGSLVGLCTERGIPMVVAQLAVLRSGAAYVPLDPEYPVDRLAFMARDAGLALVITDDATRPLCAAIGWPEDTLFLLPAADEIAADDRTDPKVDLAMADLAMADLAPQPARAKPSDPAYVIYTSGSTGRPKGVRVPHRAVANLLRSIGREPGVRPEDRLLAVTTLSFDIAVLELLTPLTTGACVVVATRDECQDGHALAERIRRHDIHVMQATPGTWRLLLAAGWEAPPGFRALVGGEPLPADLADALLNRRVELWNLYGPTETTVWSSAWRCSATAQGIRIGRPIANTRITITDSERQPCPIGVPGELVIAGEGVALGYLGRPELTAERFVDDPASPGRHAYRTGDLGRWRHDGTLEHLGRLDHQVKVRGFRIELGEIEAVLADHPSVAQAIVTVREDAPGDQRLVAYLMSEATAGATDGRTDARVWRTYLRDRLPGYMIPQHFVGLQRFTLLPNGKIDRRALPRPDDATAVAGDAGAAARAPRRRAPEGDLQRRIAARFGEQLRMTDLGADDDFFMLGGHSLLAAQMLSTLGTDLGRRIPLTAIFEAPTIARLAEWLDHAVDAASASDDPIARREDQSVAPLSLMQQRLHFLESMNPGTPAYNTPSAHHLYGPIDEAAFESAFNRLIALQSVLRTEIANDADGHPVQRVLPSLTVRLFPAEDLGALPPEAREQRLRQALDALVSEPIALDQAPLFQTRMFRLGPQEHVWFFMPHHIIWDGWSFDLFYQEMSRLYCGALRGTDPHAMPSTQRPVSYGDFAVWQNDRIRGAELQRQLDHWLARLDRNAPPLSLPADRPRPARMSGRGSTEWITIEPPVVAAAAESSRQRGTTLFMTLLTAYVAMLHRLSGQRTLVIGTPVRGREHPGLEQVMGFFVNALPLRFDVDDDTTLDQLQSRVRDVVADAFRSPDVPIERLVQALKPRRDEKHPPIWQAFFSYQEAGGRPLQWGNLHDEPIYLMQPGTAEDLGLWFLASGDRLTGGLQYNTDIFDAERIRRIGALYGRLLTELVQASPATTLGSLQPLVPEAAVHGVVTAVDSVFPDTASRAPAPAPEARPVTETERQLAATWQKLLGAGDIRLDDNFFDLGGHSMLVMHALARMEQLTSKRVNPRRFIFETLAQVAQAYEDADPLTKRPAGLMARMVGALRRRDG